MFCQIFLSPPVKRSVIIINKHGICKLPHELPEDLIKTEDFRKIENIRKTSKIHRIKPSAKSSSQNENFVNTSKRLLKNRN